MRSINVVAGTLALSLGATDLPAMAVPWYALNASMELGNQPRFDFGTPLQTLGLSQTQITGRLPVLELRVGEEVAPAVSVELSGALRQDLDQPLSNPELYQAYQSRISWRQSGGSGLNPLYYAQVEDAFLTVRDPERPGKLQFGQFLVPFGNEGYVAESLPAAIAPIETPMTDYLSTLGPGAYQGSTMARWRDIGVLISGAAGSFPYAAGLLNGAGSNRLDDNGEKDWFARLDWRTSETDFIGLSALYGQDQIFPRGFNDAGNSVGRRRYGVHWRFRIADVNVQGEWDQEQRLGLDSLPRDGYVAEASQTLSSGDLFYTAYSQCFDPNSRAGGGYLIREAVIGDIRPIFPGISLRLEGLYRWEFAGTHRDEYARILTSLDMQLGGPPKPATP